jgi:hypothetical protein
MTPCRDARRAYRGTRQSRRVTPSAAFLCPSFAAGGPCNKLPVPVHWPQPLRLGPDHLKVRMKIGVTEQAVIKRLHRVLLTKGLYLRKADSRKQKRWGFGRYYLLDSKGVVDKDVNIERLARQLGMALPRKTLESR